MSIKILIQDASVETAMVNGKNGQFQTQRQTGWLDLPSGERRKIRLRVPQGGKPWVVGAYVLGDNSFIVGQYGDLQIGALELLPVSATPAGAKVA